MINLFDFNKNDALKSELSDILYEDKYVRIERIVSMGQISPEDFVYDQEEDEFVSVVEGKATLLLTEENRVVTLVNGDSFMIKAGVKHRVTYTSSPCIWLCVFNKVKK